jgi:HlyD family secretion protein
MRERAFIGRSSLRKRYALGLLDRLVWKIVLVVRRHCSCIPRWIVLAEGRPLLHTGGLSVFCLVARPHFCTGASSPLCGKEPELLIAINVRVASALLSTFPRRWLWGSSGKAVHMRASKRIRLLSIGLLPVGLAGLAVGYLSLRPLEVPVTPVVENVPVRVFGLGTVEARVVSKIGFEVGAAITELNADHGDLVKQGQVLARLHATQQEAKVARAKAAVLSAEVAVKKADGNVIKARAILAQRLAVNKRKQDLASRQVTSAQAAEESQRDEDVAKAELLVAENDVEVGKAQLSDAKAQLAYEEAVLKQHTLVAPYDALVVERQKELGTVIKAGDPIFTLVATGSIWALAYVDESRSGAIKEGQPAEVRLRSLSHQVFPARVVRIGIESDRITEERRVYLKCEQCPVRFHLGEQTEVLITVATLAKAKLVPETAVIGYDGTKGTVWSVENGRLKRRVVTFGYRTEDSRLELTEKLPEGVEVVTRIAASFYEGRAARPVRETKR